MFNDSISTPPPYEPFQRVGLTSTDPISHLIPTRDEADSSADRNPSLIKGMPLPGESATSRTGISDAFEPPVVIGTAALTTAAMSGVGPDTLTSMIGQLDTDPGARVYDTSIVLQFVGRRADAMVMQDVAVGASPVLRVRRESRKSAALRLLALVVPGDLMSNTPLDFITNHLDVQLDLLFLVPGQALPASIPDHDLMFFAASEPDVATLARMSSFFTSWPRPVLNDPSFLPRLARDKLAGLLADVPTIFSPPTVEVGRITLDSVCSGAAEIDDILPRCSYPVLIRPLGSHAGKGLSKIDGPADLAAYLLASSEVSYYLSEFVDYRGADGFYRKYRVAFIDREPHLCHMAASASWMVHYLNAGMAESAAKRADEAQAMAHFATTFAARHGAAFAALHDLLPFDYYSIDCGELPDGRLLVFEADTAAIIHMMDPVDTFPYKHAQMRRVFDAFGEMLRRRSADNRFA